MKKGIILQQAVRITFLIVAFLSVNSFSQDTNPSDNANALASYLNGSEAGLVRQRVAAVETETRTVVPSNNKVLAELEKRAFEQINAKRAEFGVAPIRWNDDVARIARIHSENMANLGFFSHRGRDGKMVDDRADSLGMTKWTALGENIAYNRGFKDPIAIAVEKWLESPSHRENLLNGRWRESGIGIALAKDGTYYLTQVFITRK